MRYVFDLISLLSIINIIFSSKKQGWEKLNMVSSNTTICE